MSAQLGTISTVPCCNDSTGTSLTTFLARTNEIARLVDANLNITTDQPIVLPSSVSQWIPHRIYFANASGAVANVVGGIYTGANKSGQEIVPSTQVIVLADGNAYIDLDIAEYAQTNTLTSGTVYLSLTTPQGSDVTADLYIIFEDLDPASLTTTEDNACARIFTIPGPTGDDGDPGADGANGTSAYTTLTANYTQPAANADVTVTVAQSNWLAVAQIVFISGGGDYEVRAINGNLVTLKNLGLSRNAAPGIVIGASNKMTASGQPGAGQSSIVTDFDTLAPAGTAGSLLVNNGTDWIAKPAVLNNYRVPRIDTAQSDKITWSFIDLSAWSLLGVLPVVNGGTGAANAVAARTSLSAAQSGINADITSMTALTALKVGASGATISSILTATAALDFPNITNNNSADLTIAVTGAAVGDAVFLGLPAAPNAGLNYSAFVDSSNSVTVRARNDSGGAINAASATFRVVCFHI